MIPSVAPACRSPRNGGPFRADSIERLRRVLSPMLDGDRSMCRIAAERGIFCRGFRRLPPADFDRRWRSAIGRSTHLSRGQLERFADLWQLTEQVSSGTPLACDARCGREGPCRGWDEFSDADLARFCRELCAEVRPQEAGRLPSEREC